MTKQKTKQVKAWAVICPDNGYIWAFQHKDAAIEIKENHDSMGHGEHEIIACVISYSLSLTNKKKKI